VVKVFIIVYNRLPLPLAAQCISRGLNVVLVDNGTQYEPTRRWIQESGYKVMAMANRISWKQWYEDLLQRFDDEYFIISDGDLDIDGVPDDFLSVMYKGIEQPVFKCGLSLEINDLPYSDYTKKVVDHEIRFWQTMAGGYYLAPVSTTFALYHRGRTGEFTSAVRCPRPYTARHTDWYKTELDEQDIYYMNNTTHKGWLSRY